MEWEILEGDWKFDPIFVVGLLIMWVVTETLRRKCKVFDLNSAYRLRLFGLVHMVALFTAVATIAFAAVGGFVGEVTLSNGMSVALAMITTSVLA